MPSSYTIGEHYEAFARKLVESGRYASVSEVLRDGLRLMEEREQLREIKFKALKEAIEEGLDSGDAGPLDIREAKRRKASRDAALGPSYGRRA